MGFLQDEDFVELPDDDWDAFAVLERISRKALDGSERDQDGDIPFDLAISYMTEVAGLAAHYGLPDIVLGEDYDNLRTEFARFTRRVDFRTVQIRARRAQRDRRNSVALSGAGREKIQHYLEKVKAEVAGAAIPDKRKRSLMDKIADFERELAGKRFDLARAMVLFAFAAAAAHDFVGTLNETPALIQHIAEVIGDEKIEDENNGLMLSPRAPFKAISDFSPPKLDFSSFDSPQLSLPNPTPLATPNSDIQSEFDDDVPF